MEDLPTLDFDLWTSDFGARGKARRKFGATAFRVDDPFVWFPRVGPPPLCPATVQPWAGLHNPFRIARDVGWQMRDVLLKLKRAVRQPQGAQRGKAAAELEPALTQRRRG